jgi:hypothetical protein
MKLASLLLALGFLIAFRSPAQDEKPVLEPEFSDVFFRLDAGKLIPLERQTAVMHGQAHGFIVMSMKSASEFPLSKSPIRFAAGEALDFVVRSLPFTMSTVDPNTTYYLRMLNSKKKTRELVMMAGHVTPVGGIHKDEFRRNAASGQFLEVWKLVVEADY